MNLEGWRFCAHFALSYIGHLVNLLGPTHKDRVGRMFVSGAVGPGSAVDQVIPKALQREFVALFLGVQ